MQKLSEIFVPPALWSLLSWLCRFKHALVQRLGWSVATIAWWFSGSSSKSSMTWSRSGWASWRESLIAMICPWISAEKLGSRQIQMGHRIIEHKNPAFGVVKIEEMLQQNAILNHGCIILMLIMLVINNDNQQYKKVTIILIIFDN